MPEKEEGKVEITPIGEGKLSLKGVIECPKCKAKILSEIEFEMNIADVMKGEKEKEGEGDEDIREIMREK